MIANAGGEDQATSRLQALVPLLDGHRRAAIRRYNDHIRRYPNDDIARYERLCAEAVLLPVAEAEQAVARLSSEDHDSSEHARLAIAKAYIRQRQEPGANVEADLRGAIEMDPAFALAHLSLGRQLLFTKPGDPSAREHLEKASVLVPSAVGPELGLVALEAQQGNYRGAAKKGLGLVRRHPFSPRAWLAMLSAAIIGSPLSGRLVLVGLAIGLFFSYVGLYILAAWTVFALLNLLVLRRYSPRLALYPAFALVLLVPVYFIRGIALGRFYP